MDLKSSLFDSIRTAKKKTKEEEKPAVQACQWDGCEKPGTHKAPVGRMKEGEYFHFCVNHVRDYNKGFNYFSGLPDSEVARFQKEALTGNRPTWKAGVNAAAKPDVDPNKVRWGRSAPRGKAREASGMFNSRTTRFEASNKGSKPLEAKALDTLGLPSNATKEMVKVRYKELLKAHHPDTNGGDRSTEDRLHEVIHAYKLLKQAGLG
ncbi:MAG: J domain-containing protein [Rhizobiaceae bacterium]